ncbi:MAG: PEP-CTERM sorting domain-containing protein [Pseudomonadota bacterium]|nr:PEP-CTERM sorting domain-containing protein [Pseudomonadota bacterium]
MQSFSRLAAALTIGACAASVHAALPADAPPSDSFMVAFPGPGAVLFSVTIPEEVDAESAAVFGLPPLAAPGTGVLVGPGAVTPLTLPISSVSAWVALLEPAGEVSAPGLPPVVIPGAGTVSDFVLAFTVPATGTKGVAFISDGNSDLGTWLPGLLALPGGQAIPETGALQDVSCLLYASTCPGGFPTTATTYLVALVSSVPEPATYTMFAMGASLLGVAVRRPRRS